MENYDRPPVLGATIIEQDARGQITLWSKDAEHMFGWSAEEAVGMSSHIVIPPRNRARHDKGLQDLLTGPDGEIYSRTITALHREGHEFPVLISIQVIDTPTGRRLAATACDARAVAATTPEIRNDRGFLDILDQIEDGCIVVDLRGTFMFVNNAYCRMFGRTKEGVLGQRFSRLMAGEIEPQLREAYAEVYRTGKPNRQLEFFERSADGTMRHFEQSVSLERDANGKAIGFLAIIRDCTARKLAELDAAKAREAAEAASKAKSEFLANMSHEIRTPMNGIIGMTELALDTNLTPYQRDCLATVKASAESLLTILNDILDFSKIESRKLELESVPFSLAEVVNDTLKPLAVRADQKGLELMVDVAADAPINLVGDPVRLRQVLTNLLGNSIKFTDSGHVLLSVQTESTRVGAATLRFSVSDTGIGIPVDKHASIFEAFRQADGSTTRRFGGTGLGLAIASTLVRLMGGRISLDSQPGRGSTFSFTAQFGTIGQPAAVDRGRELDDVRVLIVDDNPVNRRILESRLASWRMLPVAVDGGQAAIDRLTEAAQEGRPFSLIVLDANMPDLDGFAVAEAIAARKEVAGATIMMLTSSGHYGDMTRCKELGISAYLTKPVKQGDLYEAICRALERVPAPALAKGKGRAVTLPAASTPLKVLLAEDNIVNQKVAVGLLTKRGHAVSVADNGREALAAIERETFDVVLMDVQMPEMGGIEATAAIRARERETRTGPLRIVAMTAHAMSGDRERCLAAGMDAYLSKPIDPRLLFEMVENRDVTITAKPSTAAVDRHGALKLMGGDEQLLAEVVRLFLQDCPARLNAIRAAVEKRDPEQIRREAHGLKGAAGNLAATSLFEAARVLERIAAEGRLDAVDAAWRDLSTTAGDVLESLREFDSNTPSTKQASGF